MKRAPSPELLSVAEMAEADRLAVAAGVPSLTLMENAGAAVADAIVARWSPRRVSVLCGPGNNGGDGYVAARHLKKRGWDAWVESPGDPAELKGDAAEMFRRWQGETRRVTRAHQADLVVDGLFGAGLARALDHNTRFIVEMLAESGLPVVSIDLPSGLHGDVGRPLDRVAVRATLTVTFFRKKPGHVLLPGRELCGEVMVADIGIPESVLSTIRPLTSENLPELWLEKFPWPGRGGHKYSRGHALCVSGGAAATGAARLAARGCLRVGAGLVSVASPLEAALVNAAHLTAIMVKPFDGADGLGALLADRRLNALVIGPGAGVGEATREMVGVCLGSPASVVLDADALTSFTETPDALFAQLRERTVLTPHEGEFERLFPGVLAHAASRLEAARVAAKLAGCTVLLKGPDSIVAAPDGRASVTGNAPATLATAGSGDVLAGMIAGLMAQGMAPFEASSAAAWLHAEAANRFGAGLIAEDIPEMLPAVLTELMTR